MALSFENYGLFQYRRITPCDGTKQNIFGIFTQDKISETEQALHEIRLNRAVITAK